MKRATGALIAVLVLPLPIPDSVGAQSMYRCVDAKGTVAYGVGVAPPGANCDRLAIPAPRPVDSGAVPAASEETFAKQSDACDAYYQRAAGQSQDLTVEATCEENTRERYRRDSGQPETPRTP